MLISNPLANSLFLPLARVFSAMLSTGLLGVLLGRLLVKDRWLGHQLIIRWTVWAVIAPLTVLSVLSGPLVFALLTGAIASVCVLEFCKIAGCAVPEKTILTAAALILPLAATGSAALVHGLFLLVFLLLAALSLRKSQGFQSACISLVGLAYIPFLSSYAPLIYRIPESGPSIVITVISASALANIFAFVFGKALGGPRLAPEISPNKTWWGAAGSVSGSYVGFGLLSSATGLLLPQVLVWTLPLVVAISGTAGDLFESGLKRYGKVKDAGNWLPGFGGALDRVDSLLFVLPAVYYSLILAI